MPARQLHSLLLLLSFLRPLLLLPFLPLITAQTQGNCFAAAEEIVTSRLDIIAANPRYANGHNGACYHAARGFDAVAAPYQAVAGCGALNTTAFNNVTNCADYHAAYVNFCEGFVNCSNAGRPSCCGDRLLVRGMVGYSAVDGSRSYMYAGWYDRDVPSRNGLADTYSQSNGNGILYLNPHLVRGLTWSIHTTHAMLRPPVAKDDMSCAWCSEPSDIVCPTGEYSFDPVVAAGFFGCYHDCKYVVSCGEPPHPPPPSPLPKPPPLPPFPPGFAPLPPGGMGDGSGGGLFGALGLGETGSMIVLIVIIILCVLFGFCLLCLLNNCRRRWKQTRHQVLPEPEHARISFED